MSQKTSIPSLRRAESYTNGSNTNSPKTSPRILAAPFQLNNEQDGVNSTPSKMSGLESSQFNFKPLEDYSNVTFDKYCGPTPESNWVIPNVLLVGAYPASQDDAETFELITSILKRGVTKFVCLQQEYRANGVTEAMWRSGQALRPYFEDVKLVVRLKDSIPELNGFDIVDESKLNFVHFPIKDCGITDDGRVLELAKSLVKCISEKEIIYLHCWGGHGRTGTLVCIMLHLMYGLNPVESMSRCQFVHDLRQCPVMVGSPQTQPQRDQVTRVINRLMSQNQSALFRTISEGSLMEPPPSPVNGRSPRSGHTTPVKAASQSSELLARHGAASSKQGASPEDSTQNVTDKVFSVSLSQTAPDPHLNPPSESPRTQSREKPQGTAKKEFSFTASIKSLLKPKSSTKVAKSDADIDDTSNMTIDQAVMDVEQPANSATPKPPGSAQPSSGSFIRNFRLGNITKG